MCKQLVYNAIKCPDGTVLVSRYRHDFIRHVQKDEREYFVDGGLEYQRIGYSDEEYEDVSLYTDDSIEDIREVFTWTRCMDENGELLDKPEQVLLKDITDDHLEALVKWTETGYREWVHQLMIREKEYREAK